MSPRYHPYSLNSVESAYLRINRYSNVGITRIFGSGFSLSPLCPFHQPALATRSINELASCLTHVIYHKIMIKTTVIL